MFSNSNFYYNLQALEQFSIYIILPNTQRIDMRLQNVFLKLITTRHAVVTLFIHINPELFLKKLF